jgi:acyl-coenzyme A synthetase/AMP-(fatty) acid ligase
LQILERIYAEARDRPDRVAIVNNGHVVPYLTFHRQIAAVRDALAAHDLPAGSIGAVWIDSIFAGWLATLALRSLGLTTIAVRQVEEIAAFGELDIGCIVTLAAENKPDPSEPGAPLIRISRAVLTELPAQPLAPIEVHDPAGGHIMLTSATTGDYKKILLTPETEEANRVASRVMWDEAGEAVVAVPQDLLLNMMNFGLWTAAGYNGPISAWAEGGGVVIHQRGDLWRSLLYPGQTHAVMVPAFLSAILQAPEGALPRQDQLQVIVVGGGLPLALASDVRARLTNRIATALGTTESGFWALTPVDTQEDLKWYRIHPSRTIEVVDEDDRPLPAGQLGEVRALINNGIDGYLGDPETSAQFFRGGYFYPGDLGVFDEHGRLALHGRVTDVINVQGAKVSPGAMEAALRDRLGADAVCILSEPGPDQTEELHVAIESRRPIDGAALAEAVRETLKGFPRAHVQFVEAMPRNHMGKVVRRALRQLLIDRQRTAA